MNSPSPNGPIISAKDLTKRYRRGREEVHALEEVTFDIGRGEFVAVVGPSGSGKSTLLNLVGCMDAPSSGTLELLGSPAGRWSEQRRTQFRRQHIGFVFQHFGLIATLTVAENILLPAFFARRQATDRVDELLEIVGLEHRREHRPHELSGGEMQRAAIARALVNRPDLLLADEPTGNLDSTTGESVSALFQKLHGTGLTIVVVTHNVQLAAIARRQLCLRDGRLTAP